ncbi:MAG: ArnT family glycosyltransferase [Planctomycetota bacterium]
MLTRALLLLACALVALLPGWLRADWDGTEGRRVQIALEMLRADSWMVPLLGGAPTWAKPPLHYWLIMACHEVFGSGYLALRLPGVLSAWLAAVAAGELLRPWFGARAGWLGALGLLCSPMVLFKWPTAEIDPLFATLTGVSLWALATGVARERAGLVLASGFVGGLAFLQKGPPFFLFAAGVYLVWLRYRRLRYGLLHFAPFAVIVAAYFVPLFTWFVDPESMLRIANTESVGRLSQFQWAQVWSTPAYFLRAVVVILPFGFWCFWEWRGERDARMGADDLTLRMCSGGAVLAVALLLFFPGRPTRYLLPNVLLFTFAVTPAVAHFWGLRAPVPRFGQRALRLVGALGAVALVAIPFVPRAGFASVGVALVAAVAPSVVRTPREVVLACLLLPVVGAWTVGLERSVRWSEGKRARVAFGQLARAELDALGATADLGAYGHLDSPTLLAGDLWVEGDEFRRRVPDARWVLQEETGEKPLPEGAYVLRWRMTTPYKDFAVHERRSAPK